MKKRLVSILLVLVMVLGMLPTVAFAADTAATRISTEAEFVAMDAGGNYILDDGYNDHSSRTAKRLHRRHSDGGGNTITLNIAGVTAANVGAFSVHSRAAPRPWRT